MVTNIRRTFEAFFYYYYYYFIFVASEENAPPQRETESKTLEGVI